MRLIRASRSRARSIGCACGRAAASSTMTATARLVMVRQLTSGGRYTGAARLSGGTTRRSRLDVYLIDGTYELFRHYYAVPRARDAQGREVGAVRGVLTSVLGLINGGATHLGVATDHVIESFRNRMRGG